MSDTALRSGKSALRKRGTFPHTKKEAFIGSKASSSFPLCPKPDQGVILVNSYSVPLLRLAFPGDPILSFHFLGIYPWFPSWRYLMKTKGEIEERIKSVRSRLDKSAKERLHRIDELRWVLS